MRYLSLFSGIEAATQAWHPLGWEPAAFAEVDKFACSVLQHHYPTVPNLGDVTKITEETVKGLGRVDLVVFGSPCQDLSIAGKRAGLEGKRSGLFFDAMRIVRWSGCRFALFENVPGVFSSKRGEDFASVVGEMAGAQPDVPKGGWAKAGVLLGSEALVEWCVLDAQYFGVPQRRRRVFAIRDTGDWAGRPPLFLERESLLGNPPPSRETGKNFTYDVAPCLAASGRGFERSGDTRGQDCLVASTGDIAHCLNAGGMGRQDYETETLIAHSLRADGFDASEDGTGRGTPLVPVLAGTLKANNGGGGFGSDPSETFVPIAFNLRGREGGSMPEPDTLASMRAASGGSSRSYIAFSAKDSGGDAGELAPTLRAGGHSQSHANAGVMPAVAYSFSENQRAEVLMSDTAAALKVGGGKPGQGYPAVMQQMAVRRLTPTECERLQGFPDGWTLVPHRGKPAADGPRYKSLGNSFAVPVVRWIGERIQMVEGIVNARLER